MWVFAQQRSCSTTKQPSSTFICSIKIITVQSFQAFIIYFSVKNMALSLTRVKRMSSWKKKDFSGCKINGEKQDTSSWWLSGPVFMAGGPESKSETENAHLNLQSPANLLRSIPLTVAASESDDRRRKNILHFLLRFQGKARQIDIVCALENLSCSPMVRIMYDCN